jgi:hypothetical protein
MSTSYKSLGRLLVVLGSYSCSIILVFFVGVVLAVTNLDAYYVFRSLVEWFTPLFLLLMIASEVACIAILAYGIKRTSWAVFQSKLWKVGAVETLIVALIVTLAAIGAVILPHPPN